MRYSKPLFGLLALVVLNLFLLKSGILEYFDYKIYDITSKLAHHENETSGSSVVVIDIDEKSLDYLGQWPWSRVVLANLINEINKANPSSIGLDIIFPEPDKTSPHQMVAFYKKYFDSKLKIEGLSKKYFDNDKIFAQSLSNSNSILSVYLSNTNTKNSKCKLPKEHIKIKNGSSIGYEAKGILCNIDKLQNASSGVGFINSTTDKDGVFRRLPLFMNYKDSTIPTLGLATIMGVDDVIVDESEVFILGHSFKMGENENVLLNFYDTVWYKKISAIDLLSGNVDPKILHSKFVLIGTSAIGLHDRYITSIGQSIAGVNVHATLIDNILNDDLIYQPQSIKNLNFLLSIIVLFILVFYIQKKKQIVVLFIFLSISAIYASVSIFAQMNNLYISTAYFLIPLVIGFFIINIVLVISNYKEKQLFFQELSKAHSASIDSMALVVESRDTETGAHIQRTKEYIRCLGEYLHKNDIYKSILTPEFRALVYRASPLHDIGKVAIPDSILKKPSKLTKEEFEIMKEHSRLGKEVIMSALKVHKENKFLQIAVRIADSHHEKWDGTGYPNGLKGDEIPLEARMMALADVYDALTNKRVYKEAISFDISEKIIIEGSGTHFDPILIGAFMEIKDEFKEISLRIS